jgi:hypothetical protein
MTHKSIKIASEELQIVYGEVYAPNLPDSEHDFMDEEGVREMAHNFMRSLRLKKIDVQHDNQCLDDTCVVESFIARAGDPDFIPGSWVVGVHVACPETWQKIKCGEINGFSMESMVKRNPVLIEMEVPDVISGMTAKAEDHDHEFYVSFDADGTFKGGKTNVVNGHMHMIKAGSRTEEMNGHTHRFSHLDVLVKG